jgi:lipopolysaccharide biosynthesis glycosyltransferase
MSSGFRRAKQAALQGQGILFGQGRVCCWSENTGVVVAWMHLLLALDQGFEPLAAVALTSYLLHQRFTSVVLVTPAGQRMHQLEGIAAAFDCPCRHQPIAADAALHRLPAELQPYFFCIEALQQSEPGRYLYVDADTLCVSGLGVLEELPLGGTTPLAACSHGRPMPDRALVLGLEGPYHYFNAGILLFDSVLLNAVLRPEQVVDYYLQHQALCRFREQCSLNALLSGRVQFLPGQYNFLSWMRARQSSSPWHDVASNPMAYCLTDVQERKAIVHLSAGAIPDRLPPERLEQPDHYWLKLQQGLSQQVTLPLLPRYADLW